MSQIVQKFIGNNQVGAAQERLENNSFLRGRNAANSADVNVIKVNASNIPEFGVMPQSPFTPSAANDVANKSYVDTAVGGISSNAIKNPVRVASTGNLTLSGTQTIDGVSAIAGDRVLAKNQTTASENGIYVVAAGAWARSTDADTSAEVVSMMTVPVSEGTVNANKFFFITTANPITLGTTATSWSRLVPLWNKESLTLNGTDITNQYKDLAQLSIANSVQLEVGGVTQIQGVDYSLSTVSGVTRVTFLGDLATGGAAALVSGDVLYLQYQY